MPVLPARGLTLEEVGYPADDELAARVAEARAVRELWRRASTTSPARRPGRSTAVASRSRSGARPFALQSANGVFSADGLDRGTDDPAARVARRRPGSPRVLDLGCGYGPIALGIALACPGARVDAVDVNERALALCRDNAAELGVADRVRVLLPDQVEPDGRTTRSGPTRRSGSARRRCTRCC